MMGTAVRAVRVRAFGPASELVVESVTLPPLAADEVLVRVHAAGVNPVDTYIRSGTHAVRPPLPYTPGGDAAGVVAAVGEAAARTHQVGQRVYTVGTVTGAYADHAIVKAANALPLADRLSYAQGAWSVFL
jgi:NADPH:quinone reductase